MYMRQFSRRLLDAELGSTSTPPDPSPPPSFDGFDQYYIAASSNDTGNISSDSNPMAYPYQMDSHFSPSMAIILVVLLSAFFFMGFFSVYVKRCTTDNDFNPSNPRRPGSRRAGRSVHGLDQAMVDSLPVVIYAAVKVLKEGKESTECVVCLSEFEDKESLRLLPKCKHRFHQDCIDMWLFSHTTCPLCRRSLLPERDSDSNLVNANLNEDVAAGESNPAREVDAVEARPTAPGVEVAISIRDNGMQDESSTGAFEEGRVSDAGHVQEVDLGLAYYRFQETRDPAAQDATGCGSPIFGVMESSPSAASKRKGRIRRELSRSHSTGHSLVKRAFNRANFLLPSSSDDIDQPSSSGSQTVGELHRSRSYTMLFDHWPSREEGTMEWDDDSETRGLDPSRSRENSKAWNFSFRRTFSIKRSSEEAREGLYPTLGEDYGAGAGASSSSSSSAWGTFNRLGV